MTRIRAGLRALTAWIPWPVLLLVVVVGGGAAGHFALPWARFQYHFLAAERALGREAFEEAGEHLATCLRLDPDSGRAHFLAARVARRSGQLDFAAEQLAESEDLGWPKDALELEVAMLAFQQGEFDVAAEQRLRRHLAAEDPERYLVMEALAQGYMRRYQLARALPHLTSWADGQPDSVAVRMRRGWVYERLDRFEDAEADYRSVVERHPDDRAARLRLAQVLRHRGNVDEAAGLFEVLRADHADAAVDLGLAQCCVARGEFAEARRLLEGLAGQRPNDPAVWMEQGRLAMGEKRFGDARELFGRATALAPEDYESHYQFFLCLRSLGDEAGAAKEEKKFKAIEADLKQMGDLTEALQRRPDDPDLRFRIAQIFLRRGEDAEGVLWLKQVVRLRPDYRNAHELLADYFERTGQPEQARRHRHAIARQGSPAPRPTRD